MGEGKTKTINLKPTKRRREVRGVWGEFVHMSRHTHEPQVTLQDQKQEFRSPQTHTNKLCMYTLVRAQKR